MTNSTQNLDHNDLKNREQFDNLTYVLGTIYERGEKICEEELTRINKTYDELTQKSFTEFRRNFPDSVENIDEDKLEEATEVIYQDDRRESLQQVGEVRNEFEKSFTGLYQKAKKLKDKVSSFGADEFGQECHDVTNLAERIVDKAFNKSARILGIEDAEELKNKANKALFSAYKIFTAPALWRIMGVAAVAGTGSVPLIAATTASAVAGFAVDALRVRSTRKLKKEASNLVDFRNAKTKQIILSSEHPEIFNILESQFPPVMTKNNSQNLRENATKRPDSFVEPLLRSVAANSLVLLQSSLKLMASGSYLNCLMFTKNLLMTQNIYKMQKQFIDFDHKMEDIIKHENSRDDSIIYRDNQELAEIRRSAEISNIAFEETIKLVNERGGVNNLQQAEIKEIFHDQYAKAAKITKEVKNTRTIMSNVKSVLKTMVKSVNPLSKYNDIRALQAKLSQYDQNVINFDSKHMQPVTLNLPIAERAISPEHKVPAIKETQLSKLKNQAQDLSQGTSKQAPKTLWVKAALSAKTGLHHEGSNKNKGRSK